MDPHWQSLKVPVTEDFSLDAGTWRGIGEKDAERIVEPPTVPLIDQLIAHLERSPDSVLRQSDNASGAALASLTVRFGSYFAILADASKPLENISRPRSGGYHRFRNEPYQYRSFSRTFDSPWHISGRSESVFVALAKGHHPPPAADQVRETAM